MGLSKYITRRDPSEIRNLGINLNDYAAAREPRNFPFSGIARAVRRATPVQQTGGITDIDTEFMLNSEFDPRISGSNLVDAAGNFKNFLGDLIFTPVGSADQMPVKPEDDLMEYNEFYEMPEEEEKKNLLEKILEFAPIVGDKSLTGILRNVLTGGKDKMTSFRDAIGKRLGPSRYGTSQAAFNALTPSQQRSVGSIYGQGGIMQGYNPVSAFGRGAVGAIQNRINNILTRKAPQTKASRAKVKELQNALNTLGGDTQSDGSGGYSADSDFMSGSGTAAEMGSF